MHPLNPFLRAFFRSALPAQCSPSQNHVLLVPLTEVLFGARDRDTNAQYSDLSNSEEFLASHVLRVPAGSLPTGKDAAGFRENKGKAKQYSTVNGRTVIIKDSNVYSNKGFKTLNQAQLLHDTVYYPDTFDAQPWLVYYITRPLIGSLEPTPIVPAIMAEPRPASSGSNEASAATAKPLGTTFPKKKEVHTFSALLNLFPMIARQMQPGLERILKDFASEFDKPLPEPPSSARPRRRTSSVSSAESTPASFISSLSGYSRTFHHIEIHDSEDLLRRALENAVTAAIDLFQMVDKAQLSLLGATTDLTGPLVERMIERYVTEQLHDSVLFPHICAARKNEDIQLDGRMRGMAEVDIGQVGIPLEGGMKGKRELNLRLSRGVAVFKKIGSAGSPQEMVECLLETVKIVTSIPESSEVVSEKEKEHAALTINADTLVSLLLIVVIRSGVKHLQARLSYMRHFIFIDDVESGEWGYALSTLEAVLSYLMTDEGGIKKASRRNKKLWSAVKEGRVNEVRSILQPEMDSLPEPSPDDEEDETEDARRALWRKLDVGGVAPMDVNGAMLDTVGESFFPGRRLPDASLAHVFPWKTQGLTFVEDEGNAGRGLERPKIVKRVSMDTRRSSSSGYSLLSTTDTIGSQSSAVEADTSTDKLARTQGKDGESVLMMAVEGGQERVLQYLLSLGEFFPLEIVLEDCDNEGTTLLIAAVQSGNQKVVTTLLDFVLDNSPNDATVREYLSRQDSKGRCVAHYLFHQPGLISRIGHLLPWSLKDKNGQTPLFALCRSYDHEKYREMIQQAIQAAVRVQGDGEPLHLDDHVDAKGNSLLHIVNDPLIALQLLRQCDSDPNASNDKNFTPLMMASKYGRTDLVRAFFGDERVDVNARDSRGLTAVELAKDDEVRNRIDDLVMLGNDPVSPDGRITAVVRSYFVDDGTIRLVVKSGAPAGEGSITVTTCRRSLADFENLATWLQTEMPASWLPNIRGLANPFLIPSKPSRSILREIQLKLDAFLKTLLSHPTFATHEMVWEFFLVPEMDAVMLSERAERKAVARRERIREELEPVPDVKEVEVFTQHARDSVRSLHHAHRSVLRRLNAMRFATQDLGGAVKMASAAIDTLPFLPQQHKSAFERYANTLGSREAGALNMFYSNMTAMHSSVLALLQALGRPPSLIHQMGQAQKAVDRHALSLRRSDRWPLGLLDDARMRLQKDAVDRMDRALEELEGLSRELADAREVVAAEMAGWQEWRGVEGRRVLKAFARGMAREERERLRGLARAVRGLGIKVDLDSRARKTLTQTGSSK